MLVFENVYDGKARKVSFVYSLGAHWKARRMLKLCFSWRARIQYMEEPQVGNTSLHLELSWVCVCMCVHTHSGFLKMLMSQDMSEKINTPNRARG